MTHAPQPADVSVAMALSLCRPSRAAARRLAALGPKDPANLAWRSASQAQKGEQLPQAWGRGKRREAMFLEGQS